MTSVKDQVKELFDKHDTDKSGLLDKKELPALLKELGLDAVKAEVLIKAADTDGDGKVSFDELCELMAI